MSGFLFRVFLDDDGSGVVLVGREISDTEGQRDQNDEAEPEDDPSRDFLLSRL